MRFFRLEKQTSSNEWVRCLADPSFEYVKEKGKELASDQQELFRILAPTTGAIVWRSWDLTNTEGFI